MDYNQAGYEAFREEILNRLPAYLPVSMSHWQLEVRPHYKVNEELEAFTLMPPKKERKEKGAYPVFYMEDLYEMYMAGSDVGRILRHVASWIMEAPEQKEVEESGFAMEQFRDDVVFQVINYEKNQEMLKEYPHRRLLDLAVIYRFLVFDEEGRWAGGLVNRSLMEKWKMTEEDLYQAAYRHTREALPPVMRNTNDLFESRRPKNDPMYVLGNETMQFGAAAMLYPDLLEEAAEVYGGDFLILPGSIHELYLVKRGRPIIPWKTVVETANQNLVDPREWLSDHVYIYDSASKVVKILE